MAGWESSARLSTVRLREARRLRGEIEQVEVAVREAQQRRDLLGFQVNEIEAAEPADGEEAALGRERSVLEHAEGLRDACARGLPRAQ